MPETSGFQEHWLNIDPERMERYETMFQWNPATEPFYAATKISEGQVTSTPSISTRNSSGAHVRVPMRMASEGGSPSIY